MTTIHQRIFTLNEPTAPRLNPALACESGLNESLLLLQIEFWISISNNEREGQRWTYQSTRDIQETTFPFWSIMTINRAIKSLEAKGLIITSTKYNNLKYDKTRWFTLNFQELSKLNSISIMGYVTRSSQNVTGSEQNDTRSSQDVTTIPETTTETTTDDNDADKKSAPRITKKEQPSPSLPSTQLTALIVALYALVPEQYQQPALQSMFRKVLKNHTELYIKQAIAYTIAYSTGKTKAKFKAYLGKCLDNGWADGYEPDTKHEDYQEKQARFLHSRRQMPISVLIQDSRNGCKTSQKVLTERGIAWE